MNWKSNLNKIKKIYNSNGKNNFVKKMSAKSFLLCSLATTIVAIPATIAISYGTLTNYKFNVDGKKYLSKQQVVNSIINESEVQKYQREVDSVWSIEINGLTKKYSSPTQLRQDLYSFINKDYVRVSMDLSKRMNPSNGKIDLSNEEIETLINQSKINNEIIDVYKGFNDIALLNKTEAYKSYFQVNEGYFFNGIYFNSRPDLRKYLVNDYLPNANVSDMNSFVIIAPNGMRSNPISTNKTTQNESLEYIKSFIASNATSVIEYRNSLTNEIINLTNENYESQLNRINAGDLVYQSVESNQGQSTYVLDNNFNDDNNLIGPYLYNGKLDVSSFNNVNMWKKSRGYDKAQYVASKVDIIVGQFFTMVMNDDSALNASSAKFKNQDPTLFRTPIMAFDDMTMDQWFMNWVYSESKDLYDDLVEMNIELMKGKRYNSFFKIPIFYSYMMQQIVKRNLSMDLMNVTREYFENVANFMQECLELVFMYDNTLLRHRNDDKKIFNVANFFNIGSNFSSVGTSIDSYINELKENYPNVIAGMLSYINASNNLFLFGGIAPNEYNMVGQREIMLSGFLPNYTEKDFYQIKGRLNNIYNAFSTTNLKNMLKIFVNENANENISRLKTLSFDDQVKALDNMDSKNAYNLNVGTIIKTIGSRTNEYQSQAKELLFEEVNIYSKTGLIIEDGYLSKIHTPHLSYDRLPAFLNLVFENKEIDQYQAYMATVLDVRMNQNKIKENDYANSYEFGKAITRLTLGLFGTGASITILTSKLYSSRIYDWSPMRSVGNQPMESFYNPVPTINKHPINNIIADISDETEKIKVSADEWKSNSAIKENSCDVSNVSRTRPKFKRPLEKANKYVTYDYFYERVPKEWIKVKYPSSLISFSSDNILASKWKESFWYSTLEEEHRRYKASLANYNNGRPTKYEYVYVGVTNKTTGQVDWESIPLFPDGTEPDPWWESVRNDISSNNANNGSGNTGGSGSGSDGSTNPGGGSGDGSGSGGSNGGTTNPGGGSGDGTGSGGNGGSGDGSGSGGSNGGTTNPGGGSGDGTGSGGNGGSGNGSGSGSGGSGSGGTTGPDGGSSNGNKPTKSDPKVKLKNPLSRNQNNNNAQWKKNKKPAHKVDDNWTTNSFLSKNKSLFLSAASAILSFASYAFIAAEIAFFFIELFDTEYIPEYYTYTTMDGTEFVWDGGMSVSRYFGFQNETTNVLRQGDILKPVIISSGEIENFYFFNGVKYYDIRELKRAYIKYVLNSKTMPSNFTRKLSFDKPNSDGSITLTFNDIDSLYNYVFSNMGIQAADGTIDLSKVDKNSKYIANTSFIFQNGISTNSGNVIDVIASNVVDNIRPTYVARKPTIKDGVIIDNVEPIKFPGKVWTSNGIVDNSELLLDYLVDNSANEVRSDANTSGNLIDQGDFIISDSNIAKEFSKEKLFNAFVNSFQVEFKQIYKSQYFEQNKFSKMTNLNVATIYSVNNGAQNKKEYFWSMDAIEQFIINNVNFKKEQVFEDDYMIKYKERVFDTKREFETWFNGWIESKRI